jgi:hypothetical protein
MQKMHMKNLLDIDKMKKMITIRGNLPTSGESSRNYPQLKRERERENVSRMKIKGMKILISTKICPQERKSTRSILISK